MAKTIKTGKARLVELLREASSSRSTYDTFRDFCEMAACAISNSVDLRERTAREQRYMETIKRYEPREQKLFPEMLSALVEEMELGSADVLGSVFMEMELGNKATGQFFTPYHVCKVIAGVTLDDGLKEVIAKNGFVTVNEPCSGGGAMVIAFAEEMRERGLNPQTQMHVTAQDMDPRSVHMTYVQLALLNIPCVVILGNTLALEEREHWYTPAHIINGWNFKLRQTREPETKKIEIAVAAESIPQRQPVQIGLFPEAA